MAEAFLKEMGGEQIEAQSAGLEPGKISPLAIAAMNEAGLDISHKYHKVCLTCLSRDSYILKL